MNDLCPDEALFARLATNELTSHERAGLLAHIEGCDRCRKTAAALVSSAQPSGLADTLPASLPATLEPGVTLGPYHLVRLLGAGSMGTVFAAWDPRLDRQVALKVLHVDSASLLDEARLMAKLTHPNIVTVHEVAKWQGRLVLVMELIGGGTLRAWLSTRPALPAVVKVFAQLADALATAHTAGVVHRDFKPDNVLVDLDGRPRLTDFGLGTLASKAVEQRSIIGTPAYLAPAQLDGRPGDERADQFAFCVALWEASTGERPFRGSTLAQLRLAQRTPPPKPAGRALPRWLDTILRRGLSVEPEARFAAMAELARALRRGPVRERRLALGAVAALAALSAWALATRAPCETAGDEVAQVVTEARLAEIERHFAASGVPYAAVASAEVGRLLREAKDHWRTTAREVCAQEHARGLGALKDSLPSQRCLDLRRRELEALVEALARVDSAGVERSVSAAINLLPAQSCLSSTEDLPRASPEETRLRSDIAALRPLAFVGSWQALEAGLEALRGPVGRADSPLARAEFEWLDAVQAVQRQRMQEAFPKAKSCFEVSMAARADTIAAECMLYTSMLEAVVQAKPDVSRQAYEVARSLLERTPHATRDELNLAMGELYVLRAEGRHAEALERAKRQAEAFEAALGARHQSALVMRSFEALELSYFDRLEEARARYGELLKASVESLGESHPRSLTMLENVGYLDLRVGHLDLALAETTAAFDARTRTLGPEAFVTAHVRLNLAAVLIRLGRLDEAQAHLDALTPVYERERGKNHLELAEVHEERARLAAARGDTASATTQWERAVELRRNAHDQAQRTARATLELARALQAQGAPPARWRALAADAARDFADGGTRFDAEAAAARALTR